VRKKSTKKGVNPKNGVNSNFIPTDRDFVFLPLGGTNEVGMNFGMLGHDGEWLIIDCGVTFYDRLGIDVITADPTFAVQHRPRINGIFITHAHEDHIGAVEYLWPILKCPVYASPFAAAILRHKIEKKSCFSTINIKEISYGEEVSAGKFTIEALQMTHSTLEPSCFVVTTPLGTVVHTGDWKFEQDPVIGEKVDETELARVGKNGVLAYLSDSTNIFSEEDTSSEKSVRDNLTRLILENPNKRITIACFASNIARLETAILAAEQAGRKVAVIGRSLQRMIAAAQETGYLRSFPKLIDEKQAMSMPPGKVMMICTGSQGENLSALVRIASGKHPVISMNEHDVVFFSSRVIPGNEKSIGDLHSFLARQKVDIITSAEEGIHSSGHPSRTAIKQMYQLLQPEIVVPVHGEARHLIAQAHFAKSEGIKHVIVPNNGALVQLAGGAPAIIGEVKSGKWAVDGKRMVVFDGPIIKERSDLSEEGAVFATIIAEKNAISNIKLSARGLEEPGEPTRRLYSYITDSIRKEFSGKISAEASNERAVAQKIAALVTNKLGKTPVVEVHIIAA
jgi:ribonuclease J